MDTQHLRLRTLTTGDALRIEELAGDYDVAKSTLNIPHPYPKGSAVQFIESVLAAERNGKIAMFAVL